MGMSEAEGEDRALRAAQEASRSPLLNDNDIRGAKFVLLNITHGEREVLMDEIDEITDHIQEAAGSSADVIWGYCKDESLGRQGADHDDRNRFPDQSGHRRRSLRRRTPAP